MFNLLQKTMLMLRNRQFQNTSIQLNTFTKIFVITKLYTLTIF